MRRWPNIRKQLPVPFAQVQVFFPNFEETIFWNSKFMYGLKGYLYLKLLLFVHLCFSFTVYTQLVTVAVYAYFLAALFGRQFIKPTL
jgi:hypothetical protein